jgi:hypothetical protein
VFSGLIAEVDGVGDKRSGDTTTVDVQTPFSTCPCDLHVSLMELFLAKAKLPVLRLLSSSARLSEFLKYQTLD